MQMKERGKEEKETRNTRVKKKVQTTEEERGPDSGPGLDLQPGPDTGPGPATGVVVRPWSAIFTWQQ